MVEASAVLRHAARMCLSSKVLDKRSSIPMHWRKSLSRPASLYALSSLLYVACGVLEWQQCRACPAASPSGWPASFGQAESLAVMLQGVLSYCSDVLVVGLVRRSPILYRLPLPTLLTVRTI